MALKEYRVSSVEMKESERPQHRYLVLRKLGQGTYGKVQLALNKETNQEVAIKTIKKAKIENDEDMLRIRREIHIMRAIRHPHIIHINEVFETKQKIVIVMQYASGGELYDYLGCHQTLPEDEARRIFRQIASAIYYCHKNQICHRDLKLENILLDEEGNAQIADFGLSNVFDERRRMNTFCGSPLYASPEIVKGTPYKGPEVDCWSLGVLLYTLIYGTMPFDGRNFKELVSQISEGRYEEPINKSNASNLIRRLLTPEISRRATIIDVCKDNWVNKGYEVSLLEISEMMATELENNNLKTRKFNLEAQAKNRQETLFFRKSGLSSEMQTLGRNSASLGKTFEKLTNSVANQTLEKHSLYEQIINYDVRFVINKLISAVEASIPNLREDRKANTTTMPKENEMPRRKTWPRNGEMKVSDKVDSAYVIPIFEVTSVVHKSADKAGNHEKHCRNFKRNSSQNAIHNKEDTENLGSTVKTSSQNAELTYRQFKDTLNQTHTSSITSDIVDFTKRVDHCDLKSFERYEHQNRNVSTDDVSRKQKNDSQNVVQLTEGSNKINISQANSIKINDKEHALERTSSSKTKRICDNDLFSQKSHGFSFKAKNHTLSLARILSLNYEKMFRNSFKKQERKKKLPGKISIPATFDPAITPTIVIQREKILLFPTVSVSENKEKIEKKIEKIKKAALNMNLIRRSNTKNRLRIQKYLKSQAKRMQDLACDEQRNFGNSIEHLSSQHSFSSVSDSCNSMFEAGGINTNLGKYTNKELSGILSQKMHNHSLESFNWPNFGDAKHFSNDHIKQWHLTVPNYFHRRKQCSSDNNLNETKRHLNNATIAKSKSEIKLPEEYLNHISFCDTYKNLKDYNTKNCAKYISSNIFSPLTIHAPKDGDHERRLVRSASDSNSLNSIKNLYICNNDNHKIEKVNSFKQQHSPGQISYSINGKFFHNKLENIFSGRYETHKITTHLHSSNNIADCKDYFQKYENSCNERKEGNACITRSMSTNSYMSRATENPINIRTVAENTLPEPHFKNTKCINHAYLRNDFMIVQNDMNSDSLSYKTQDNEKGHMQARKVREIKRRNTLNGTIVKDKREMYRHSKSAQDECEGFENSLWNAHKEEDYLPAYLKDESQFSSSPNLNHFSLENKINHIRHKDSKSVDSLNISESSADKTLYNGYTSEYSPCKNIISDTSSMTLNKNKPSNNIHKILYDHSSMRRNRTKSNSDETLPQNERSDFIRKLHPERKLSFQENTSATNNIRKAPFKSNFLNELEKREQLIKVPEDVINQRRYPISSFTFGKRTKSQSRSQSFLQLLSLKRIQEAEKELDKVERNDVTVLEEDNSGSLLEALKTHGYKNVISQRFHEEEYSFDAFNYKYRGTPFSGRNVRLDSPRFNFRSYNTLPRYVPSVYEFDETDNTRNIFNSGPASSYEMSYDFTQKTPKSFVYDWLPINQNESNFTSLNTQQEITSITDEKNQSFENDKCCPQWSKENAASSNREESPSEPSNSDQNQNTNGGIAQDLSKIRDQSSDYYDISDFSKSEKIPFCFGSVNSEEEREESVQDRIWRKSFYSRFNNSALSRKERSTFLDPEFFSETRTSFLNNIYSPLKLIGQEKNETVDWSDCNKVLQQKRTQAAKTHGTPRDKISPRNSIRRKFTKCLTEENAQDSKRLDTEKDIRYNLNIEREEPEPEH